MTKMKTRVLPVLAFLVSLTLAGCGLNSSPRFLPVFFDHTLGSSNDPTKPVLTHTRNDPDGVPPPIVTLPPGV